MVDSLEVFVTPQKNSPPAKTRHQSTGRVVSVMSSAASARTHLVDGEGTLVSCVDLSGSASREVEQLDEPRNHLVLLLRVAQTAVPSEAPAEDPLLGVQHQLHTTKAAPLSD